MQIKPDWQIYLHDLRQQEADLIFGNCPPAAFDRALELGAGDGYLSRVLARYSKSLLCTEINEDRLCPLDLPNVEYRILDAERIGEALEGRMFDFIFSSNLLEHLPDADGALAGMYRLLAEDGLAIHVLPNRTWKAATVLCFIPNKIVKTLDKLLAGRLLKRRPDHPWGRACKEKFGGNNQKLGRKKQSRLTKLFLPPVHGISANTLQEFCAFGRKPWIRRFEQAGFEVIGIKKMPFNSGYGFGFRRLKRLAEGLGLHGATAFILCRKGRTSRYVPFFVTPQKPETKVEV